MNTFLYYNPTKILFGRGQVAKIKDEIPAFGRRVLPQLGGRIFGIKAENKKDADLAAETIRKLREFWSSLGAPDKLSDYGIDDSKIDLIVERAMVTQTIGNYG